MLVAPPKAAPSTDSRPRTDNLADNPGVEISRTGTSKRFSASLFSPHQRPRKPRSHRGFKSHSSATLFPSFDDSRHAGRARTSLQRPFALIFCLKGEPLRPFQFCLGTPR